MLTRWWQYITTMFSLQKQLDCKACYQGRLSNPLVISCNVQADEEVDSLMEELEQMDTYDDRPLTGTSTAEDSLAQVLPLSS